MISSFITEVFIYLFVFSPFIYMPNLKLFSITFQKMKKVLEKNEFLNNYNSPANKQQFLQQKKNDNISKINENTDNPSRYNENTDNPSRYNL